MSLHTMKLSWKRATADFQYATYSREHTWTFDGGHQMRASSAPAYLGDPALVDPEEAFVAALSSCHMLTFLAIASKKRFTVDEYVDDAVGLMEKSESGTLSITRVTLSPHVRFSGENRPSPDEIAQMHHAAHKGCFLANSVKSEVRVELPVP